MDSTFLDVYSIFLSIDGEINSCGQGGMTIFIRLAGCNLNCNYCDTLYAHDQSSGKVMSIREVLNEIGEWPAIKKITITGGEPLLQKSAVKVLLKYLEEADYKTTIETNGSIILNEPFPRNVSFVVDFKLPSSEMSGYMKFNAFTPLKEGDYVKFVIEDELDFREACGVIVTLKKLSKTPTKIGFAFSPMAGKLEPNQLYQWMMKEQIPNSFLNVQLHKILGLKEEK